MTDDFVKRSNGSKVVKTAIKKVKKGLISAKQFTNAKCKAIELKI